MDTEPLDVGLRIREIRQAAGMTMSELAAESNLSTGYISQVERGITNPSVGALGRICQALGIGLGTLFFENEPDPPETDQPQKYLSIVRHDGRNTFIPPGRIVKHQMLCADFKHAMEFCWSYIPGGETNGELPSTHRGEECIVVIKGTLEVYIEDKVFSLEEGDAICFDAAVPHGWRNLTNDEVQIIWAASPPHF